MTQQVTLADNVHDLTRRHIRRHGPTRGQWEEGLLDQLEDAVTGIGNNGGQAGNETPAPINIKALDTQRSIAETVRDHEHKRGGDTQRPVDSILAEWADDADADEFLVHVTLDLIDEIREAIEPQVKPIPLDQACPDASCGKRRIREQDETGAWVSRPALRVHCRDETGHGIAISKWTAQCSSCGRQWHGAHELAWLSRLLWGESEDVMTTV